MKRFYFYCLLKTFNGGVKDRFFHLKLLFSCKSYFLLYTEFQIVQSATVAQMLVAAQSAFYKRLQRNRRTITITTLNCLE